jgi:hypothetical protein
MNDQIQGIYEHYKGNHYEVLFIASHTETLEDLVVYRSIKSPEKIWVRPKAMFTENVDFEGRIIPRFTKIPG